MKMKSVKERERGVHWEEVVVQKRHHLLLAHSQVTKASREPWIAHPMHPMNGLRRRTESHRPHSTRPFCVSLMKRLPIYHAAYYTEQGHLVPVRIQFARSSSMSCPYSQLAPGVQHQVEWHLTSCFSQCLQVCAETS